MSFNKKLFYVNSNKRVSGTHSDFSYHIDLRGFSKPPTHCVILQANIPKSYYMIQSGYNTIDLSEEGGANVVTISLPPGNYNRTSLRVAMQTLLNSESPNGYSYTITTPSPSSGDTGKYTFTCTGHILESSIEVPSNSNMYEVLGFVSGSSNEFVGGVLESTNVVKLSKEDTLIIHSDIVTGLSDNVLQEIYAVDDSTFGNVVFANHIPEHYEKQMQATTSSVYRFYLQNENGQPMELNGLNLTFTLCCYVKDNTNAVVKDYVKYKMARQK